MMRGILVFGLGLPIMALSLSCAVKAENAGDAPASARVGAPAPAKPALVAMNGGPDAARTVAPEAPAPVAAASPSAAPSPSAAVGGLLVIGDSHCTMSFGKTLDAYLREHENGMKVSFYGSSSASTAYYFKGLSSHGGYYFHPADEKARQGGGGKDGEAMTPKLSALLARKPKVVVVALGSNQFGWNDRAQAEQISATIGSIQDAGARCIWVGPPGARPDRRPGRKSGFVEADVGRLYKTLSEVTGRMGCRLIDSRPCATYPAEGGDGMHFDFIGPAGRKLGKDWGEKVGADIVDIIGGAGSL
jgi:hypothetical protein